MTFAAVVAVDGVGFEDVAVSGFLEAKERGFVELAWDTIIPKNVVADDAL